MTEKERLINDYKEIVTKKYEDRITEVNTLSKTVKSQTDLTSFYNECLNEFSKLFPYAFGIPNIIGLTIDEVNDIVKHSSLCAEKAQKEYSKTYRFLYEKYGRS